MSPHSFFHPHFPRFVNWGWSEQELTGLLVTLGMLLVMLLLS